MAISNQHTSYLINQPIIVISGYLINVSHYFIATSEFQLKSPQWILIENEHFVDQIPILFR